MLDRFSTYIPQTFAYVELSIRRLGVRVPSGALYAAVYCSKIFKKNRITT
jgi:hypothetical protein